jgi:hypothetical protein
MSKAILDADTIPQHASPLLHQRGPDIQPCGHLIKRTNGLQVWFVAEHLVDTPVVRAE